MPYLREITEAFLKERHMSVDDLKAVFRMPKNSETKKTVQFPLWAAINTPYQWNREASVVRRRVMRLYDCNTISQPEDQPTQSGEFTSAESELLHKTTARFVEVKLAFMFKPN